MESSDHPTIIDFRKYLKLWPGALLLVIFLAIAIYNSFLCDDAFITFRYARNLANGLGPVFNAGERVEGYTDFLWMILLSLVIKFGGSPERWSQILAIAFSLGTILIFLISVFSENVNIVNKYLFATFLAFSAPFWIWSTGGLETAAFTFFLFAGVVLLLAARANNNRRHFMLASLMISTASLTRPEGVLVFCLAFVYLAILVKMNRIPFNRLIFFALPFVVIYGGYFIWRFNYYGKLFPNTFYVKAPGIALIKFGLVYYWNFLIRSAPWIPIAFSGYLFIRSRSIRPGDIEIFLVSLFILWTIYVIYAGGDFMALSRFIMPILPPLFYLLHRLYISGIKIRRGKWDSILAIAALAVFIAINSYSCIKTRGYSPDNKLDSIETLQGFVTQWSSVGRLISQNCQPTDTIAVTPAGAIPFYTGLYTIDMHGLVAPDIDKYEEWHGYARPGHFLFVSMSYLFYLKPHFIIGHPKITVGQLQQHPFGKPQDINPNLRKKYTAASVELPDLPGLYFNFWVRNDVIPRISQEIKLYRLE